MAGPVLTRQNYVECLHVVSPMVLSESRLLVSIGGEFDMNQESGHGLRMP